METDSQFVTEIVMIRIRLFTLEARKFVIAEIMIAMAMSTRESRAI